MLARAVAGVDPRTIVLVCCGDLPGLGPGATRYILDVRETVGTQSRTIPIEPDGVPAPIALARVAVVWPRAHLGKDFAQQTLARAGLAVPDGGRVLCAVRKQKGAEGIADFMGALFGNVRVVEKDKGYRLLGSDRGARFDEDEARRVLGVRYRYDDPVLGDLVVETAPGVFSRRALDEGTRCVIDHVAGMWLAPTRVLDLCAGVGTLGLWALQRWPEAEGLAVESNVLAAALAERNASANAMGARLRGSLHDGLPDIDTLSGTLRRWPGATDLALVNPPTHADAATLRRLLDPLRVWLTPGAPAVVVASRPGTVVDALKRAGATVEFAAYERYTIVEARWPA
jgi:16S rRNA G1207 methylase RsmC